MDKIEGIDIEYTPASREANVYMTKNNSYKIYKDEETTRKFMGYFGMAATHGIPIPNPKFFNGTLTLEIAGETKLVTGIKMDKLTGTFIQLSNSGKETELLNIIGGITNKSVLIRLKRFFDLGKKTMLADPQFFYTYCVTVPVVFFDIHFQSYEGSKFDSAIKRINTRLIELEER